MRGARIYRWMKLKLRLTLWFLAISLIPMVLVLYFSYNMTRRVLLVQFFEQLKSLANVQKSRVDSLLDERKRELSQFADRPQLRALLEHYVRTGDENTRGVLNRLLATIQLDQPHYKEITLLDLRGIVLATTGAAKVGKNYANAPWYSRGRVHSEVSVIYRMANKSVALRVSGPLVIDERGQLPHGGPLSIAKRTIGVCAIVTDADALVNLMADRTGLGETGEVFITTGAPNWDALVLTSTRGAPDAAPHLRMSHLDKDSPAIRALNTDEKEVYESIDSHGASVYSASRHIDAADWGLVVKIDKYEALQQVHKFRDLVLWALLALTLLTVLASFSLARSITEPLESLTQAAKRASEGDLSTRVPVRSEDELGFLGNAFNHMAFSIETMHAELETKVHERTAELESANIRLKELDRVKSEFLATMSHELRTPLNSIMGFSEVMLTDDDGTFEKEQSEQLLCIYNSARHLLKIIDEILEVSKIEAGRMSSEPQWFSVRDTIRQAADILRPQAILNNLQISLEMPEDCTLAYTDPSKLLRVLVNLMGNAVKFTHQGGVHVRLQHRDGTQDGHIEIEVRDTGIGIRDEDLAHLFQPFKQVDSSTRRHYEGTGLGLYYSRKVIELLGGTIAVRSVWQEGSTFTLTLPVRRGDAPPPPAEFEQTISGQFP